MLRATVIFPGQGSQYIGMGKSMHDNYKEVKAVFEEASSILGYDVAAKCFHGSLMELHELNTMLSSILVVSVGAYKVFQMETGLIPVCGAGHSLGQYTALVCSNIISLSDALRLLSLRSRLVQSIADEQDASMSVIEGLPINEIEEICRESSTEQELAFLSCYNAPEQVAISGHNAAIRRVEQKAISLNGHCSPLVTGAPFHCALLEPVIFEFREELSGVRRGEASWPVLSNRNPRIEINRDSIIEELCLHMVQPVRWMDTLSLIDKDQVDITIEIGPQSVLTSLNELNNVPVPSYSFCRKSDLDKIKEYKKASVDNPVQFTPTVITKCLGAAVSVPNKNWNEQEYDEFVVKPFEKIRSLQMELEKENRNPSLEEMKTALSLLQLIFRTKGLSPVEQEQRLYSIIRETATEDMLSNCVGELIVAQ